MKRIFILVMILWPMLLAAQITRDRQFAGKINLTGVLTKRLGVAVELLRSDRNKNLEFQASYQWQNPPTDLFNGDWDIHYAQTRSDMIRPGSPKLIEISPWAYMGDGRPTAEIQPANRVSILQFQLGLRMSPEAPYQNKKWRLFAQPGLSISRHRFFEVRQSTILEQEIINRWQMNTVFYSNVVQMRRTHYLRQHNEMRLRDKWLAGVTFDLGAGRTIGRRFFLEGRLTGGFHLDSPYQANGTSAASKGLYGQATLYAGYFFGKKTRSAKTTDI